jgi:hypothetical protein
MTTRTRSKCTTCGRRCWTCGACNNRTYCEFCNSCNLHGQAAPTAEMIRPPRGEHGRLFVVSVAFLTRRGWSAEFDVRVRSQGLAGAIWKGVRQARREHLPPRTRVQQARVSAVAA